MTTILSALVTVVSRCAITSVVCSLMARSRASCTRRSLSPSRADVASSSSSTLGRGSTARAMATRCRWPPLNCTPRSPTSVP
mmetsp:Transcript_89461/g.266862  ORF Transcript_89461/g.266862 Transcript_89461/m.266862 type:complete len:82 (-) Transcript_89461:2157-2402(-)